jgi:isoamylase
VWRVGAQSALAWWALSHFGTVSAAHPSLRCADFLYGKAGPDGIKDISWLAPAGREMAPEDWNHGARCVGVMLNAGTRQFIEGVESRQVPDIVLLLVNAGVDAVSFRLPIDPAGRHRVTEIGTSAPNPNNLTCDDGGNKLALVGRAPTPLCLQLNPAERP